jgi:cytochrome P450
MSEVTTDTVTSPPGDAGMLLGEAMTPDLLANPHPLYHRVRSELGTFYNPDEDVYIFTRYAECEAVLRDPRWSTNPAHRISAVPVPEAFNPRDEMASSSAHVLLFIDPPDHTRIRNLVSRNFTPKAIAAWRPRIAEIVDELLDDAAERGEVELISEFAYRVPVTVICELLGVPAEDRHLFGPWSSDASRLLDGVLDDETVMRGMSGAMQLVNYLNPLIDERRTAPRDDLLSKIVQATDQDDGLAEEELRSLVILLFIAGHETTTNLIGNGMKALLEHPDQLARFRDDPGLIGTTVEEILRFDGPVHVTARIPIEDLEINGQAYRKGQQVVALLAAANRDPDVFADPDRFDVSRTPNLHLAFSKGIHHCLGAALARLEGQHAIGRLVERFPDVELLTTEPQYREHFVLRGLRELRLDLHP